MNEVSPPSNHTYVPSVCTLPCETGTSGFCCQASLMQTIQHQANTPLRRSSIPEQFLDKEIGCSGSRLNIKLKCRFSLWSSLVQPAGHPQILPKTRLIICCTYSIALYCRAITVSPAIKHHLSGPQIQMAQGYML